MKSSDFKNLDVWNLSMDLVSDIYLLMPLLPEYEKYGLCDQMRRAAISIPSNIAEGQSRNGTKEFIHFLSVARGSASELETQLLICERLGYFNKQQIELNCAKIASIGRMLKSLMNSLYKKSQPHNPTTPQP